MSSYPSTRDEWEKLFLKPLIRDGSRTRAIRIFDEALEQVSRKLRNKSADEIIATAISNTRPLFEVTTRRVGEASYQVPAPVAEARGTAKAVRAIVDAARKRPGPIARNLAIALKEAYQGDLTPPDRGTRRVARISAREAYRSSS